MRALVIGGAASGKSAYAESLLQGFSGAARYYVATMEPYGEEGRARMERHHKLRAGKGFATIECYRNLMELVLPEPGDVLLECMTTLVANEMFAREGMRGGSVERVMASIHALHAQTRNLVVVTGDLFADGLAYAGETDTYLRALAQVNAQIASCFDLVVEVVYGLPCAVKGELS